MRRQEIVPGGGRVPSPAQRTCAPGQRRSAQWRPSKVRRRPAEYTWGSPPPRSTLREVVDYVALLALVFGSLILAAHIGLGRAL